MGDPVKIIVTAETADAIQNLKQIVPAIEQVANAAKQTATVNTPAVKVLKEMGAQSVNTRLAMMELGHVARSTAEGLAPA